MHGRNLHPRVGWVQRRCYGRAELTQWQSIRVLLAVATFCSGGRTSVWPQRCRLLAGDGSAVVVHHWMLPLPQRHLDDRECHRRAQGVAPGRRTNVGGLPQYDADGTGKRPEGNVNCGDADRRGTRGHGRTLPSALTQMGQGTEDVDHVKGGEGSPVPDGLYPGDRPPSLMERVRSVSKSQHRSLYGVGLPLQRPREVTHQIPHGAQAPAPLTASRPHVGARDLRVPTEGRAETTPKGEEEERVDFGEMWRLVDKRVSARRNTRDQTRICRLNRAISASLKRYRKRRVETVGEEVERYLGRTRHCHGNFGRG